MAGKRQATSDLNHDNWDREEEPEERGVFRTASEDELKSRVIKKAKRKIVASNDAADSGSGTKSVFSGFSGFGKPSATSGTASAASFSFLNKIPSVAAATSGTVSSSTASSGAKPQFSISSGLATGVGATESSKTVFSFGNSANSDTPSENKLSSKTPPENSEYLKKLSSLNQAVCEWIKTHVEKNPVCILSPIFKDYEKYLEEIENIKKKSEVKASTSETLDKAEKLVPATGMGNFKFAISNSNAAITPNESKSTPKTSEVDTKANGFSLDMKKQETLSDKPATSSSFSFNLKPSTAATTPSVTSSFSFGKPNPSLSTTTSSQFSFAPGSSLFSFGNIKPPETIAPTTVESEQNEEDEEPPKNEFKQVVEDDAVYSKKCKVFVKKDGNFVDKGVGTLYLKPVESSGKTQLLVRADTNLGNILVNLILNSAIPAQRMGKNNVMMVCLPTPDVEKPTSMLLRVKTSEEADELLENIDKHKK